MLVLHLLLSVPVALVQVQNLLLCFAFDLVLEFCDPLAVFQLDILKFNLEAVDGLLIPYPFFILPLLVLELVFLVILLLDLLDLFEHVLHVLGRLGCCLRCLEL